jgi:hypothetical protein
MSSGTKRGSASAKQSSASSAKKPRSIKDALLGTSGQVLRSLQAQYKGKRLLLSALSIYGSKARVPTGKETYNFMYRVKDINPCGTTCTIEYEGRYIEDGGTSFKSYPPLTDHDLCLENYCVALIKEDHECTISTSVKSTGGSTI